MLDYEAIKLSFSDEFLDKLTSFVELEYNDRKIEAITPSERMKAVA